MRALRQLACSLSLMGFVMLCGCTSPPKAPDDLETLLGYIFEHMDDEDPTELIAGLENLHEWMQDDANLQRSREGLVINNLPESALQNLDGKERSTSGLEGITVTTKSGFCAQSLASLLTWEDFGSTLDNFSMYERTFTSDPTCFGSRDCLKVRADSHTKSAWAGLVGMESRYGIQFRWVKTKVGWMMLQRFWLKEPVNGDQLEVKMKANYYIGIIMDDGERASRAVSPAFRRAANGVIGQSGSDIDEDQKKLSQAGTLRIHANWFNVDTGVITLPKAAIRDLLINSQVNDAQRHDNWLESHPDMVDCPTRSAMPSMESMQ